MKMPGFVVYSVERNATMFLKNKYIYLHHQKEN